MKKSKFIIPAVFILLIFPMAIINLISPDKTFSESENRKLKTSPKFTLQALFDSSYTTEFEEYITDQ
ncbi:MAG: hypothetical protein RSE93_08015, partial [Oscillospiraceae bacterium]